MGQNIFLNTSNIKFLINKIISNKNKSYVVGTFAPLMNNNYIPAGVLTKTIGLNGALQLKLNPDFARLYNRINGLFIELNGQYVPYLIVKLQPKNGGNLLVELEDVENINDAQQLVGREVFITKDVLPTLGEREFYHHEIEGFTVIDTAVGELGVIDNVADMPQQSIIAVQYKGQEVLIPLAGEILVGVDRETKTITVRCPDGLIDMYLTIDKTPDDEKDGQGEEDEGPAFVVKASGQKKYFRRAKKK